jgi:hypothetical protein
MPMKINRIRAAARAAALLLVATLAACADAPTGATEAAGTAPEPHGPQANVSAFSTVTVTNSGGYPLVSWSPVAGATSYTVNLVTTWFHTTWRGDTAKRSFRQAKGSTTGTSLLDTSRVYSGDISCTRPADYPYGPNDTYTEYYEYEVVAQLAGGTSTQRAYAPVGECF